MIASLILVVNLLGLFDGSGGGVKISPLGQISEFRVSMSLCSGDKPGKVGGTWTLSNFSGPDSVSESHPGE